MDEFQKQHLQNLVGLKIGGAQYESTAALATFREHDFILAPLDRGNLMMLIEALEEIKRLDQERIEERRNSYEAT